MPPPVAARPRLGVEPSPARIASAPFSKVIREMLHSYRSCVGWKRGEIDIAISNFGIEEEPPNALHKPARPPSRSRLRALHAALRHHWLAKIMSLALAVTLWVVIRKSIGTPSAPSRIQFEPERRPSIEFSTNGKK